MIFKRNSRTIFFRVLLLFLALLATAFFIVKRQWLFVVYAFPFVILTLLYLLRYYKRIQDEMAQFVESVHYRDFTRNYVWKNSPTELQSLRKGFNEINAAFKTISREKETQYQYLKKILELVDTGILSFEIDTGEVLWMNESLKKLLEIPYLNNIQLLEKRNKSLHRELQELKSREHKVIRLEKENNRTKILLTTTAFQTEHKIYKLIVFQNINEALDETESLAWQKLLSVMTHEIMNSVAPIASLADTLKKRVQHLIPDIPPAHKEGIEDLELGIDTIKRRSEGLTKFAETYRNLSKITHLQLTRILVPDLFENIYQLMHPTLEQKNIELEIVLHDTGIIMEADRNLLEQVLINLILNAVEAVKEKHGACITLSAANEENKTVLSVTDNGKGIVPDLLDKIFIPFFSTHKKGTGIGLSLCKQIMMLHGGNIQIRTREGSGTAFRLVFGRLEE